ncbi:MAG TPA: hypothetical protein VHD83_16655 [Puia sp.]|nr:hypothetical protein [Puia sp.]
MNVMELKAYEILKDKLGEEKAAIILGFVEGKIDQQKEVFLTKEDKMELIRATKEDKMELIRSAKEDKVDLIKWMVGFWIVQIAAIIGLYLKK